MIAIIASRRMKTGAWNATAFPTMRRFGMRNSRYGLWADGVEAPSIKEQTLEVAETFGPMEAGESRLSAGCAEREAG